MTVSELTDRMIESSSDISETQVESKKGFKQGVKNNLQLLGD